MKALINKMSGQRSSTSYGDGFKLLEMEDIYFIMTKIIVDLEKKKNQDIVTWILYSSLMPEQFHHLNAAPPSRRRHAATHGAWCSRRGDV